MNQRKPEGRLIGPLTIESLANGGKGIARENGRVVFVADAFPGDVVTCRLKKEKKNYAEAEVAELLQPSPQRRTPPCPVAEECGGCQWQQLPYAEQCKWKQQLFSDTLTRQTGIDPALILPLVPSSAEFGYRSRVQVKCSHSSKGFVTGFYRSQSRFVVAVDQCPLMPSQLNRLLSQLREPLAESTYASQIPQIDLSIGSDERLLAVVHYLGKETSQLISLLRPLAEQFDFALGLQSVRKDSLRMICGTGDLSISVDRPEIHLHYAAGGFAQVNLQQNQQLVNAVVAAAALEGHEQVLDLYCGMGNFSLPLARRAASVTGVENHAPSIRMARRNAAANNIKNIDFQVMESGQSLRRLGKTFDLLVLDPPRAGAYSVVKQLPQNPVARIIYVSCDPQTLARDLKFLISIGYKYISSQAFDMFPQTYHVESLTVLEYCPNGLQFADVSNIV